MVDQLQIVGAAGEQARAAYKLPPLYVFNAFAQSVALRAGNPEGKRQFDNSQIQYPRHDIFCWILRKTDDFCALLGEFLVALGVDFAE